MTRLQKAAFSIARTIGKHPLASRVFCLAEQFLPLERLGRSADCVAFAHPRPSYDPHILVVPTSPFPTLVHPGTDVNTKAAFLWEMIGLAREVTAPGPGLDWQMIVNGGARQDIGQVHGHLIHAGEHAPSNYHFQFIDPSADIAPWEHLFNELKRVAAQPDNGYSVVFQVSGEGPVPARITQSDVA